MTPTERDYVRELARQVAAIAHSPENAIILKRWRDVNALRRPDRAPVWCRPVGVWSELLPESVLKCADPYLRRWEADFRRTLIKKDIGDDEPVEGYLTVGAAVECEPQNIYGVQIAHHEPDEETGAWRFDPPLKSEADFAKLRLPRFSYNKAKTDERLAQAHELLGDIMPVRVTAGPPLGASLCDVAAELIGLNELMLYMAAEPEMIHRLMAYLRDTVLAAIDAVEASGYLTPNNTGPMFCADPIGSPYAGAPHGGAYTCKNLWCVAASQEFQLVGPKMWEEFLLEYQKPVMARFGISQYGCCEDLTHKIAGVLSIPNLRVFVCSAWTDLNKVIAAVGQSYTIMWRQRASDVVFPDDMSSIRRHLEQGTKALQGHYYQVVLRELQTLAGHPRRLHDWARAGIEMAEKYA